MNIQTTFTSVGSFLPRISALQPILLTLCLWEAGGSLSRAASSKAGLHSQPWPGQSPLRLLQDSSGRLPWGFCLPGFWLPHVCCWTTVPSSWRKEGEKTLLDPLLKSCFAFSSCHHVASPSPASIYLHARQRRHEKNSSSSSPCFINDQQNST